MANSVSVTTNESWFSRLFGSIKSVLVGLIFFAAAFPLLWWNESRAVQTARSLSEGAGAVVSSPAATLDASNEGKLVHMNGVVTTDQPVSDDEFPVEAQAVKLLRKVEMFQWNEEKKSETRKKLGGGEETVTTYSYDRDWAEGRIDSSQFQESAGHENPEASPYESATFTADPVRLGAHKLSTEQIGMLNDSVEFPIASDTAENLSEEQKESIGVAGGRFYLGVDSAKPEVGDVRISYSVVKPSAISIAGVQSGDTFAPYQAKEGDQILLLQEGTHTAAAMFQKAQDDNVVFTWILRAVGFIVMWLGIFLVFRPIAVFADVIPLFGTMLGAGIGIFSFIGAAALSFFTIALAWIFYRPMLGISLMALAAVAVILVLRVGKRKKAARAAGTAPPLAPEVVG